MTRRDWWLVVALLVAAITLHALVPRYEWRRLEGVTFTRADHWTGRLIIRSFTGGRWVSGDVQ